MIKIYGRNILAKKFGGLADFHIDQVYVLLECYSKTPFPLSY